ncbi:Fc receptor-like protein 5 isoform X3 [Cavia porcellus]|uniref:Fc receptor-like protein 5 isoform X3 n=1 Tax=Cavia porcellus TaxID=10141 RepID=UPI002FE032D1
MLLWATLLVLASASGQFATTPKPVISLHPPWTPVFQGDTVSLTCNGFRSSSPKKTQWYNGQSPLTETRNTLDVYQSGKYSCRVGTSLLSDPVHLDFTKATLILQTPLSVFEGDSVNLRCLARAGTELENMEIYKNGELLALLGENNDFNIRRASLENSGNYHCMGVKKSNHEPVVSKRVKIQVQELFSRPVLTDSLSESTHGNQVTLSCKTQILPQKSNVILQFCFYRNNQSLESGCSNNPGLQISAIWPHYSGFYQCKAGDVTSGIWKESQISQIYEQMPISQPVLTARTRQTQIVEGQQIILNCEVDRSSPEILYQFLHEDTVLWETKTSSILASFSLTAKHSGNYYCIANSGFGPKRSKVLKLSVIVPVSQPILTFHPAEARTVEGSVLTLHCEDPRGSLPILYQFYREKLLLPRSSTRSDTGASYRFSLTEAHSGNYYCTADNGFGSKRSNTVSLSVTVPVSQPILTFYPAEAQTIEGSVLTLHCEAHRGSLPILYQFYLETSLLDRSTVHSGVGTSYRFSLTEAHSGNYYCTADNGFGSKRSNTMSLSVIVPVSLPLIIFKVPRVPAVVGDMIELQCEAQRGSPPIVYHFFHEDVMLGSRQSPSGGGASFKFLLTEEHSGNYLCEASNVGKTQRSKTVVLNVKVPVSRPAFTLRASGSQAVVGNVMQLHCEALRGSPPILYRFYHEDVMLGNSSASFGGGTSFNFTLTVEHSGNYSCEADNDLEVQRSETVTLKVTVPVSRPVLTLRVSKAQAMVGDVVELHCEALRGSPPILYRFYHENVVLRNDSTFSAKGVSFNLSLTAQHSGNYSCEADNGLGAQKSELVTLFITGPTENRSAVATGVTGALLSILGLAAGALLFYFWFSRKAGERSASDFSRNPSDLNPQETTYQNVPGWIELQPVYINVNPRERDVVYSEVRRNKGENKYAAASRPKILTNEGSPVIYSQVKVACTPASRVQQSATSDPHR